MVGVDRVAGFEPAPPTFNVGALTRLSYTPLVEQAGRCPRRSTARSRPFYAAP